jgi:alpha-glucosidase
VVHDLFWAYLDAFKLFNTFNLVLIIDSTYKTNRYRMPLLEVVGVTTTNLTFCVGFAYLELRVQTNSYVLLKDYKICL